jgi:hypothetical protein
MRRAFLFTACLLSLNSGAGDVNPFGGGLRLTAR